MAKQQKFISVERTKMEALVTDNVRLRSVANKIWLKWWFVPVLLAGSFAFAYAGAMFGSIN